MQLCNQARFACRVVLYFALAHLLDTRPAIDRSTACSGYLFCRTKKREKDQRCHRDCTTATHSTIPFVAAKGKHMHRCAICTCMLTRTFQGYPILLRVYTCRVFRFYRLGLNSLSAAKAAFLVARQVNMATSVNMGRALATIIENLLRHEPASFHRRFADSMFTMGTKVRLKWSKRVSSWSAV